jgi:hypothetical protein
MSLTDVLAQLEQVDEEMSKEAELLEKVAREEEAAGRIMARGFMDELDKLAEGAADWIGAAMPKNKPAAPKPAPMAKPKMAPVAKPKSLGTSGDTMSMKTVAPGSAQAKAINAKAKAMPKPKSMAQTEREQANATYERNRRLQEQQGGYR